MFYCAGGSGAHGECSGPLCVYGEEHDARAFFDRWHVSAIRSRFTPMVEMVMMLEKRITNDVREASETNATCEPRNPTIQWVKYMGAATTT